MDTPAWPPPQVPHSFLPGHVLRDDPWAPCPFQYLPALPQSCSLRGPMALFPCGLGQRPGGVLLDSSVLLPTLARWHVLSAPPSGPSPTQTLPTLHSFHMPPLFPVLASSPPRTAVSSWPFSAQDLVWPLISYISSLYTSSLQPMSSPWGRYTCSSSSPWGLCTCCFSPHGPSFRLQGASHLPHLHSHLLLSMRPPGLCPCPPLNLSHSLAVLYSPCCY